MRGVFGITDGASAVARLSTERRNYTTSDGFPFTFHVFRPAFLLLQRLDTMLTFSLAKREQESLCVVRNVNMRIVKAQSSAKSVAVGWSLGAPRVTPYSGPTRNFVITVARL